MTYTRDVIVIGGGIMGSSIALALRERGVEHVTLVEKRFPGAGSSGKSGAILRAHYSHETTIAMARDGLAWYRDFGPRTGRQIGFRQTGVLVVVDARDREPLERNVALMNRLGVPAIVEDAAGLRQLEPRAEFGDEVVGAHEPTAGYVSPMPTLYGILAEARARGVELRIGEAVAAIETDGDRVSGVRLDDGRHLAAPTVVNAGGPWALGLLKPLGVDLPLQAIRPEQAFVEPPGDFGPQSMVFADLLTGVYWKPETERWTRIGMLSYEGDDPVIDPDDYDECASDTFGAECRRRIGDRLPAYHRSVLWGGCGALYTVTPDAHPVIGPVDAVPGLWVVAGWSGHGFKMGPAVGYGVAGLITRTDTGSMDPSFFAPDRFAREAPIASAYEYGILG